MGRKLSEPLDVAVVGAGIVGLATARALLLERPGLRLAVLEKEEGVGRHQTGHNSGVVHSGVYYAPGSLKARFCLRGKALLEAYAAERDIPILHRGKLIVALDESELGRLGELRRRALANEVEGLRELAGEELAEIEPHARGVRGLHVPRTGVVDYGLVARTLADDLRERGCQVLLGRAVTGVRVGANGLELDTPHGAVATRYAVACAGLQSDRLARLAGARPSVRILPFRGDYYTLSGSAAELVNGLLYPVPDPGFPFLGVHFTRRIDGSVVVGPNAVLALARERYRRLAFDRRDAVASVRFPGLWRFARRHLRMAAGELWRDVSKRAFLTDLRRYVGDVDADDLTFGPTGVRAQAMTPSGALVEDFLIEDSPRMMHVLNAPSPAATASLAIGEELAGRALRAIA